MCRTILHCDMNNFYASVECNLNPKLRGKPVAVGGDAEERHGIILAKNYQAKAYGVQTGEALWQAKQKCKDLIIVPPNYEQYLKYSKLARQIYADYTDQIEPYGMDECWLDSRHCFPALCFGADIRVCYASRHPALRKNPRSPRSVSHRQCGFSLRQW